MEYLKNENKNGFSFKLDCLFNEEERKEYEKLKLEKYKKVNNADFSIYNYYDRALLSCINFEIFIFEKEKRLENYIKNLDNEYRHWRKAYTYLKVKEKEICVPMFENIGKFICGNFDNIAIQKFLYQSTFYKCMAIEYAYSIGQNELAEKIIYLGYDRYFEFETLYLMKKHNEKLFYEEIKKLKKICFRRNLYEYYKGCSSYNTYKFYGKEFSEEFYKLAKQMIKEIENSPDTDPRKNDEHIIPDWAK